MSKVTLEIAVSKQAAVADLRSWGDLTKKTFGEVLAQSARLNTAMGKLTLNPDGIIIGAELGTQSLQELNSAITEVRQNLRGLGGIKISPIRGGLGAKLIEDAERTRVTVTAITQRQVEQQKRLDDSLAASRYRNTEVSAGQYRQYLTQRLSEENNSVQQSIRLNNELADLQIDAMRRVTEAMRSEEAKRTQEARQAAQLQARSEREAAALAGGSRLMQRGTNISAIGSGMRSVGQAMTWGYSAPVVGAVGYSVKKAIDYEADFANVKKTVGGSDAELKALRTDLEALSTQVPESFKTITDIASTVGQLGVARGEVRNVTKDIIQLHVATKLSTDTGAMAMVKFANSIGLPAKDIGRLGSVISELDKDSKATSNEVLAMALRIGGVGHVAGLSGPQILAFANAFAGVGVRAQQGGSAISQAIIQIDRAVNKGGEGLTKFANVAGMSGEQFKKTFNTNTAGALASFIEGLNKLHNSHADLIPVMDALGLHSKLEIDALLRASGAGNDLSKALGRVDKAYQDNTATGERYRRATDNTQSTLIKLRNESDLLAAKLGTQLLPSLLKLTPEFVRLLDTAGHLIDRFEALPQPVKDATLGLLAISVLTGPLISGLGGVFNIVGGVTRGFAAFKALRAAKDLKDVLTGLTDVEGGAKGAGDSVGALATKTGGLKGLLLSPLSEGTLGALLLKGGLVTLGVGLDVYLLKKDFDTAAETKGLTDSAAKQDAGIGRDGGFERNTVGTITRINQAIDALRDGIKQDRATLAGMPAGNRAFAWLTGPVEGSPQYKSLQARIRKEYADMGALRASARQQEGALDSFHGRGPGWASATPVVSVGSVGPAGTPAFVRAMMADSGKVIGKECGEAISFYLGRSGAATGLDTPSNAVRPDAQGQYPEGTIFRVGRRFHGEADGEHKYSRGHYGALHYGPAGPVWVEANYGIKGGVTKDRPFDMGTDVREATWGGRVHAYLPPNVPRVYPSAGTATGDAAAPRRVPFDPSLFVDPADKKAKKKAAEAQSDLSKRLYEATHNEYQNQRYEAYQAFKDDKGTDPAKAKALLLATLTKIDQDEEKEQKKHHQETERQQKEHLARLKARQKEYWDGVIAGRRKVEAAKATATEARAGIADQRAALADPDAAGFAGERSEAHRQFRERVKSFGGDPSLSNDQLQRMPYSPQTLRDFQAAQDALQARLADIGRRQGQKGTDQAAQDAAEVADFQRQATQQQADLNREVWQHAGGDMKAYFDSLRKEADDALAEVQAKYGAGSKDPNAAAVAAAQGVHDSRYAVIGQQEVDDTKSAQDKIDQAQAESVRFEYEQHIISLRQYQDYLRQKLATTRQYETPEDQKNGVLSRGWMQLRGELDASEGETRAKPRRAEAVGGQPFWDGLAEGASEAGSRALDSFLHPKDRKGIFKAFWADLAGMGEDALKSSLKTILKNALTTGGGGILGGLFGGRKGGGGTAAGSVTSAIGMIGTAQGGGTAVTASPLSSALMPGDPMLPMLGMGGGSGMGGSGMAGSGLPGGLGTDPGMNGMGGGASPLGLLGMLGKGGLGSAFGGLWKSGGLFAKGGLFNTSGALGGFGAALPWIGGGLMLNSMLGNPLGKALKGLKKVFHFDRGGRPALGHVSMLGERGIEGWRSDTGHLSLVGMGGPTLFEPRVPGTIIPNDRLTAMFAPRISVPDFRPGGGQGAGVSPQGQTAGGGARGGDNVSIVVHQTGDHVYHSEMDIKKVKQSWASGMERDRRAGRIP